ncbi:hypothetical protein L1987_11744 [Smallanthus sonchifolius]|uniref:Uncharacterized protein n=1 Tax=Smallanthus sonchifolius TaxID=185202 RepID=A0ACB9JC59_9ASTR|nr:hypothetical protein L1987_11744 [Smallanthus sonchifolius]
MASSLLTRSVVPFRPAYRLLSNSIHSRLTFDRQFLETQMKYMAGVPSVLLTMVNGQHIVVKVPGLERTESDEGLHVSLNMPGLVNDVIARFEANYLLIEGKTHEQIYLAAVKLPEKFDRNRDWDGKIKDGRLKITLPVVKNKESDSKTFAHIMTTFLDTIHRPTLYSVMFDQQYLGKKLWETIAHPTVKSKWFTIYKETAESLYIKGSMPGPEKMKVTSEGQCVSLSMPGLKIEDSESCFEYDTFIVVGRREDEHYIAGIRVPEDFHKKHDMIKTEMQDGMYMATLPHAIGVIEEEEKKTNLL